MGIRQGWHRLIGHVQAAAGSLRRKLHALLKPKSTTQPRTTSPTPIAASSGTGRAEFEIVKVNRLASRSLGFSRVPVSVRLCVAGSPYLLSQRFDRQAVHLLDEFSSHHFELLDQGPAFLETAGSGVIFKA